MKLPFFSPAMLYVLWDLSSLNRNWTWVYGSDGEGHGNPLQYSCLGNAMDRGAWWATVHVITESEWLRDWDYGSEIPSPTQWTAREFPMNLA